MRVGQTSLVVFVAKVVGSALGFLATLYFARTLGADVIGIYAVILSTVAWLQTGGRMGISKAANKRISEGTEQGPFLTAGYVALLGFVLGAAVLIVLFRPLVESYIGEFDQFSGLSVVWFIIAIVTVKLTFLFVTEVLKGQRMVYVAGILKPVKTGSRSIVQIALVLAGGGLVGMLVGYVVGVVAIIGVGLLFVNIRPMLPERRHFESLFSYAKFSWVGGLKARALNDVDIVVLNALVATGLVGVYAVAWNLSKFLDLFSSAIGETVFPEISNVSAREDPESAVPLVEDTVAYAGLITIPGVVGGTLLADRLLRIYGEEFVQGVEVLWLLILSIFLFSYYRQFLNVLNALDYPEYAFRANLVFIATNVVLNVTLIWQLGWIGAAVASVVSVLFGMVASYTYLTRIISFRIPFEEIGRQALAALVMGVVVFTCRTAIETAELVQHNVLIVVTLVGLGAGVYVLVLLAISREFRDTVDRNLPVAVPYL